jgi:broad specificity phosphatase PhoE
MRLLLVRHAESSGNAQRVLQGHLDFGLSDHGRAQSALLADRLARMRVDAIYTSTLRRALETATIVADELGLEIRPRSELVERNMGELAGLTGPQIRERFPEYVQARRDGRDYPIAGLESDQALFGRVLACLHEIIDTHPDQHVTVITHGGVIGAFVRSILDIPPKRPVPFALDNTAITTVEIVEPADTRTVRPRMHVISLNDTCHLDGLAVEAAS